MYRKGDLIYGKFRCCGQTWVLLSSVTAFASAVLRQADARRDPEKFWCPVLCDIGWAGGQFVVQVVAAWVLRAKYSSEDYGLSF